jgi:hypothetical protein
MIPGATSSTTSRLILGEISYAQFLGECNQAAIVDNAATAQAFTHLLGDPELRERMGSAGRTRAVEQFAWKHIVAAYESLWRAQEQERQKQHEQARAGRCPTPPGPAKYPAPEHSFAGYPTRWLTNDDLIVTTTQAESRLSDLLALPISNYAGHRRSTDANLIADLMQRAAHPQRLGNLRQQLQVLGMSAETSDNTLAWMLKYGLLQKV